MEIQNKLKHKKRRTRKNLDEMRKRSRITKEVLHANNDKKNSEHFKRNNQHITSARLTLALFNKTVKSETVTRTIRTDCNTHSYHAINSKNKSIPTYVGPCEKLLNSQESLINKQNDTFQVCQTNIENSLETSSPDSIISFSPGKKDTHNINKTESELPEVEVRSLANSHLSSDSECDHCIYDEFMSKISTYLIDNIPVLAKEEVIKRNIHYLQKTYLDSCHQETENNILKCIKSTSTDNIRPCYTGEAIIQNPMHYIQIKSSYEEAAQSHESASDSGGSEDAVSQYVSSSYDMLRTESPEYIYFPHKLNQ